MTNKTLFLHAGRPKTASTFLQRSVFPQLSAIDYIEKPDTQWLSTQQQWQTCLNTALMCSPKIWDVHGERLMTEVLGREHQDEAARGSVLVSDETIAGAIGLNPDADYYWRDPAVLGAHVSRIRALAAYRGFDDFKILLVVRRQDHAIASGYAQISDRRPATSQRDFDSAVAWLLNPGAGKFQGGVVLDYNEVYQCLGDAIGADNVTLVPYEMLRRDSDRFLSEIANFLDSGQSLSAVDADQPKHNVRSRQPGLWTIRNRHMPDTGTINLIPKALAWRLGYQKRLALRWPDLSRGRTFTLSESQSLEILSAYESSNRALADALGLDLAQYGYYR